MSALHILEQIEGHGGRMWREGDRLRCRAPSDVLTPEVEAEMRRLKPVLLEYARIGVPLRELESFAGKDWSEYRDDPAKLNQLAETYRLAQERDRLMQESVAIEASPEHTDAVSEALACYPLLRVYGRDGLEATYRGREKVRCGDCRHFERDMINPRGGIGSCEFVTRVEPYDMPQFPFAERDCEDFDAM